MKEKYKMNQLKLIIPVYLNQRIVFDLIAMLQDGLSTVTRISESESSKDIKEQRYGVAFGLNKALSTLLKIDVSGEAKKVDEGATQTAKSEEKIHTPASLFYKLRNKLIETKNLTLVNLDFKPESGQFIEFRTVLNRNPLIQAMDALIKMINLANIFVEDDTLKSKFIQNESNPKNNNEKILNQMEELRKELKSGDTVDIVSEKIEFGYQAVITLENEFLNDPLMSDIVDGTFQVIGKITEVIPANKGKISLLRKTVFSAMPVEILQQTFGPLSVLRSNQAAGIPELKWDIEGPVLHVIPLAIFA